jgi:chlorite dismutase
MAILERQFVFSGAVSGAWSVQSMHVFCGEPLAAAPMLSIDQSPSTDAVWSLVGVTSNMRYTTSAEAGALTQKRAALGRSQARLAALIPIRKNEAWWALPQDERRAIYEERSHHTTIGLEYLPRIARRLHHSRDLGEPFDFLTWFEFAPEHESDFEHLLQRLRTSEEWSYVDREIDIRLRRVEPFP